MSILVKECRYIGVKLSKYLLFIYILLNCSLWAQDTRVRYPLNAPLTVRVYGFNMNITPSETHAVYLESDEETHGYLSNQRWYKVVVEDISSAFNSRDTYWVKKEEWVNWMAESGFVLAEQVTHDDALSSCDLSLEQDFTHPEQPQLDGLTTSLRPESRPAYFDPSQNDFWNGGPENPYQFTMEQKSLVEEGYNSCVGQLWRFGEDLLSMTSWSGTTHEDRANLIQGLSENVLEETIQAANESGKNHPDETSLYRSSINPYYIDPAISPELMSCISYQETRGGANLNPMVYNGTYCNEVQASTAFGLGGITASTVRGMVENASGVNLMPWLRQDSMGLRIMQDSEEIHQGLMYDPAYQLEAMIYILNEKIKFIRKNNPNMSEEDVLMAGIAYYDQDHEGPYVSAVSNCIECLNNNGDAFDCYENQILNELPYE